MTLYNYSCYSNSIAIFALFLFLFQRHIKGQSDICAKQQEATIKPTKTDVTHPDGTKFWMDRSGSKSADLDQTAPRGKTVFYFF